MKAAVINRFGDVPEYREFDEPPVGDDDLRIRVSASALENFDKVTAAGTHYASRHLFPSFPAIVGHSGVGLLDDGTVVAFGGTPPPYGTMAEVAAIPGRYREYLAPIPAGIDVAQAAALPSSALTSLLPLVHVAKLQAGQRVLVNGATGASGKVAVQVARALGAGTVIGTGRDRSALAALQRKGADATIALTDPDDEVVSAFRTHAGEGYDVVLDFIWGRPTELFLQTVIPEEAAFARHRTRLIQIGESAGSAITLTADSVRTSGLEILGSGNVPAEVVPEAMNQIWRWMEDRVLVMDVELVALKDVARAWVSDSDGKRIVIIP